MKSFHRNFIFLFIICILLSDNVLAQFSISGEFRPRFEYRDGYLKLRDSSQTPYPAIIGRNRLIFDYSDDRFTARFNLQHAYVFGENTIGSDTITRNTLNIHEAYFRVRFAKKFAFKIGRTELLYDDGRLLGNRNWNPRAIVHDVGILQWESTSGHYRGDFGFAINNNAPAMPYLTSYPQKNYKYMGYLYEQRKFMKDNLIISILAILDVNQKPTSTVKKTTTSFDTLYVIHVNDTIGYSVTSRTTTTTTTTTYPTQLYGRFTIGGTVTYKRENIKVFGAGYYQGGRFSDGRKINAGYIGGYISYRVVKPLNLLVGYDYYSGNDYSDTTGIKTHSTAFSNLYGSNHKFYGYMDMFPAFINSGNSAGLKNLYVRGTLAMGKKADLEATWWWFSLAEGYLPATVKKTGDVPYVSVDKNLGSEIDLMCIYRPFPNFEINAAYCFFLPTSTMEQLDGLKAGTSKWAQFAYVMLTYKPTFFSTGKK